MRILIIENDKVAFKRLEKLIRQIAPEKKIAGRCASVKEAHQWFHTNPIPDLILSVIQLPDGLCFEIFKPLGNKVPVILTCAYDKYAIDAFKTNCVDYLIKPVKKEELSEALKKYDTLYSSRRRIDEQDKQLSSTRYQKRFIVTVGKQMKLVPSRDIAYFFTENKVVFLVTFDTEKYTTDYRLEQLEKRLDPKQFYRINRQFIINVSAITKMSPTTKARLKLSLKPESKNETITSFERTAKFRKWLIGAM